MTTTPEHDAKIAKMTVASVYPHYVAKVEKKDRTKKELNEVINWLTGYNEKQLQRLIDAKATFETFFGGASLNPNAKLITGTICGYRVEEIETPLTQQVRYLDKLINELAKGWPMEKILRRQSFNSHTEITTGLLRSSMTNVESYSAPTLLSSPIADTASR